MTRELEPDDSQQAILAIFKKKKNGVLKKRWWHFTSCGNDMFRSRAKTEKQYTDLTCHGKTAFIQN